MPQIITLYWFLPAIILLGIITTYTDLKESKIRNKHVLLALAYSFVIYILLIILNLGTFRIGYFIELAIMCALSLITGFTLWYIGLWTAGDAKLFFAYSALTPLSVYKYGHIPYFDSTNILINTFVPMSFYFFLILMFKTNIKQKLSFLKQALQPKETLNLAVSLFAILWVANMLFKLIKLPLSYFLGVFLIFIILMLAEKLLSNQVFKLFILISILRLIFDPSIYSLYFVKDFLLILGVFVFLRIFILRLGFKLLTTEVDIGLLKKGMIPAETIYEEDKAYKKQNLIPLSLFSYFQEKTKEKNYLFNPTQPLTKEDIDKIWKLRRRLGLEHLKIQQTIPFAPFLFLGVLLTLLAQGNFILILVNLIF